jgi:hypothetical protein
MLSLQDHEKWVLEEKKYIEKNPLSISKRELEKKYASALDNYGQSCFVRSYFLKWSVSVRHKWCPLPDHKKEMKSNYLSFCEYLTNPLPPTFHHGGIKKWLSPTTCHYQIFDENQNPVDMHTSIMCINIIQNIKAVAPKL